MFARAGRRSRRWAGLGAGVVLAACAVIAPPDAGIPAEDVRTTGRALPGTLADDPTGPHVELLTATVAGQEMEIAMQRDGGGTCIAVRRPPASVQGCGGLPGDDGPMGTVFGLVVTDGPPEADPGGPVMVAGLVTADVGAVVAELEDGSMARAVLFSLAPADVEGSGFVLYLQPDLGQRSLVAHDVSGSELARLEFRGGP